MDELNKNNVQMNTYTAATGQPVTANHTSAANSLDDFKATQQLAVARQNAADNSAASQLALAQHAAQQQAQLSPQQVEQRIQDMLQSQNAQRVGLLSTSQESIDAARANGTYHEADPYAGMSAQERAINEMYDAYRQGQLNQLESAYQQQLSDYQAAADKIPGVYQTQANDLASQYERQRRNFNEQAAANGLNTGTASQAQLAQNSAYQRAYSGLRTAQADAQTEAERQMLQLENSYKTQVAAAISNNDFERARALLDEYNNAYNRDLAQAQTLAQYGDFSGYANIYGQEAADQMSQLWNAQNPYLAYATGRINQKELNKILAAYGTSGSSGSKSRTPGTTPPPETPPEETATPAGMDDRYFAQLRHAFGSASTREDALKLMKGLSEQTLSSLSDEQKSDLAALVEGKK